MKLTKDDVGKRFKCRDGEVVTIDDYDEIYTHLGVKYPFHVEELGLFFNEKGKFLVGMKDGRDLISRVTRGRPKGAKLKGKPDSSGTR